MRLAWCLLAALVLAAPASASPANDIPDATLRITVQQKAEGKIVSGYLVFELSCRDGDCALSSVMLNQCVASPSGEQAFSPQVHYASTSLGNLKVRSEGTSIVVRETGSDMIGEYVNDLRFEYAPTRQDRIISRLTGFSGSYVKHSAVFKKVFALDYVPLPRSSQVRKLDCGVLLPGIGQR